MQSGSDDDAWRSIVENYGERPALDPEPESEPVTGPEPEAVAEPRFVQEPPQTEERFVPPPPPPVPRASPDRAAAWFGVFGCPVLLLVFSVAGVELPSFIGLLLVAGFVAGFLYLVLQMPRGPREPWDDGAQL